MKKLIACLGILSIVTALNAQTVNTEFGNIQGSINGTVYQFLGIPFAKTPVGTLRWKAPQNPDTWANTLTTISFAPACPQKKFEQGDTTYTLVGNEDCLYLNVWTPQTTTGNLPVLFFIHGGGNQQGSTSEVSGGTQMYFGKNMAERGNAVVVTIAYRLGPLGFLVHPGLEAENGNSVAGNYAVLDQILALKWVQNNIGNFGGDPSKVMIFGESAGGVNVGNLLLSPLAKGLFQRACIESAIPDVKDYNETKTKGIAYVDSFTTLGTNAWKIEYMRTLPADSLMHFETSPVSGGVVQMNWRPVVDNIVFTGAPKDLFQSGNFNKVPLIIGSNSEEMSLSAPQNVLPVMVTALVNNIVPSAYQAQAHLLYPSGANQTEARVSYVGVLTDGQFTATSRRVAQCVSQNQAEPVWRYFFTHKHTIPQLAAMGSYHGMELFYVFNNWENATLGKGALFHSQDDSVQKVMLDYWVNFANTGNPNGTGLVNWPQYQSSTDAYLEIKATPEESQTGLRTAQSNLWDQAAGFTSCTSSYSIATGVSPANSGTITGAGNYSQGANVSLTATAQSGYAFTNWTESGTPVSTNATYSFTAGSNRTLIANFQNTVGIETDINVKTLSFYPNPTKGIFQLLLPEESNVFEIKVFNFTGQLIYNASNTHRIDLSKQRNGIFLIEVKTNAHVLKGKIMKAE